MNENTNTFFVLHKKRKIDNPPITLRPVLYVYYIKCVYVGFTDDSYNHLMGTKIKYVAELEYFCKVKLYFQV